MSPEPGAGDRRQCFVAHEAWYAPQGGPRGVHALRLDGDGSLAWELSIDEVEYETLTLTVHDRSWRALLEEADVLRRLVAVAESGEDVAARWAAVVDVLREHGFEDVTPRTEGDAHPAPSAWTEEDLQRFADGLRPPGA